VGIRSTILTAAADGGRSLVKNSQLYVYVKTCVVSNGRPLVLQQAAGTDQGWEGRCGRGIWFGRSATLGMATAAKIAESHCRVWADGGKYLQVGGRK
jgi:hypothetical protein